MTKGTKTIPCDRCHGLGLVTDAESGMLDTCPSCLGQRHVEMDIESGFEAIILGLTAALPKLPYGDRKTLERTISDALFSNSVDAVHREAWTKLVDTLRQTEGE